MNAIPQELPDVLPARAMPAPVLRTLVICDLADSTALVEKFGDRRGAEIMRQHDRLARDLVEHHQGREIDKTDGFLILFERPVHAVAFALDYQRALRALGEKETLPLAARIGIHVGDVVLWDNVAHDVARGAKPVEVEGLVKPIAARIMSIARPGQILLSGMANALAQRARAELGDASNLRWQSHGNYRFKGLPETVQVHEVGEEGIAPFRAPAWSGKAHREIPWWRRPAMLAIEVAVVLVAVAVPAYFSLRSPPAIAFAERDWVVVGDLKNLTGQGVLDDSLDTAFRVSLEQSRFVNLVPTLQVNDALKRMQKPDGTKIDRTIGAEVAMREGARALILPSIAEVGGRVRVTAEVVDPRTQATVYVESADGSGLDSILPSVGKVSGDLRVRLGEALASVDSSNVPLPKVTTGNLDALRAYSLSQKAYLAGNFAQTLALLDQALKLDPDFALANLAKAAVYLSSSDNASAKVELQRAQKQQDRLPPRDALRADALLALIGKPDDALRKYKLLGEIYPDTYGAYYNYALVAYSQGRYDEAMAELNKGLRDHNPYRDDFHYFLGTLQLATENYDGAATSFDRAAGIGNLGLKRVEAAAISRRFDVAEKLLAGSKPSGVASNDISQKLTALDLAVDRGQWPQALALASAAAGEASSINAFAGRRYRATELSLLVYSSPPPQFLRELRGFLEYGLAALKDRDAPDRSDTMFQVLWAGYLAAHAGDVDLANVAIAAVREDVRDSGSANLANLLAVASAERLRAQGNAAAAIALLLPERKGAESYLTHVALRDAYATAGQTGPALDEARWLAAHRGRAYEEFNEHHAGQPANIVESNLSLLVQAELAAKAGKTEEAAAAKARFLAAWPQAGQIAFVKPRLDALASL